jgi:hypothetical protein
MKSTLFLFWSLVLTDRHIWIHHTCVQLMNIFQKNYDMLLDIFNPEGWLEITYPLISFLSLWLTSWVFNFYELIFLSLHFSSLN